MTFLMQYHLADLYDFLEFKYQQYNTPEFIPSDPISVPHLFTKKQDIEIAGFLTATISWGSRKSIIANARKLVQMMDDDPHRFILEASENDLVPLRKFVHRTFNGEDCIFFLQSLKNIFVKNESMEKLFLNATNAGMSQAIRQFREEFLLTPHQKRSEKHISDPLSGSSAKRINMFLRWMVRDDSRGVDFGVWKRIAPSELMCPLDVHSGNVARKLGILTRKANDWKAVEELTASLRRFDPVDPVKYDFALFGLGIFEDF
jgi:uncharacterized protein (TIGR02757 family)